MTASAMRPILLTAVAAAALTAFTSDAQAGNYILYFHGRSQSGWAGNELVIPPAGWTNVTFSYNGSERINGDATNVTVRNALSTYCTNGNICIVNAYSAGVFRVLKAMHDLGNRGGIPGLAYVNAGASAAGGSALAELSTRGITGLLSKIFGVQEAVDFDLTRGAARNNYGYVQDAAYDAGGAFMFHTAGSKDLCVRLLFGIKLCSGRMFIGGTNDGVVGFDSAAGYEYAGSYSDACNGGARYPGRAYETANAGCGGESRDHFGMSGRASSVLANGMAGHAGLIASAVDYARSWSDATTERDCIDSSGECDLAFADGSKNFCKAADGTTVCTPTAGGSAATMDTTPTNSCQGSCGKFTGVCWCDANCLAHGDCCADYWTASNCSAVNSGASSDRTRFYRTYRSDAGHFETTNKTEAVNAGYAIEGTWYAASSPIAGTTALYRCVLGGSRHFATTSSTCENAGTSEGILGYVFTYQAPGTIPLYRRYSSSANDHLYSLSYDEGASLGYAYEGIAGYVYSSAN